MHVTIGTSDAPTFREIVFPDDIHVPHHPFPYIFGGPSEIDDF